VLISDALKVALPEGVPFPAGLVSDAAAAAPVDEEAPAEEAAADEAVADEAGAEAEAAAEDAASDEGKNDES
jgi:hypothetical protein